jgi:catechol 2,3-dioxygenase-like lactoylglutathione lyase family enzyme
MKRVLLLLCLSIPVMCAGQTRPKILGIAHISLYAHDYQASRAFYRDFLGFEEPYSLTKPDGSPSMTFFKINERQYIELSPETQPNADRLNHYALETDDAEAMRQYLAAHGVAVPNHVPKGRIGNLNFMIQDPEGHKVEIVQYPSDSWTAQATGKFLSSGRVSHRMMHVGIVVTRLREEMKFYTGMLGFQEMWRGSSNGKALSWINLKVPDGGDYLEFMLYREAPPPDKRGSAHHLCLEVSDVNDSVAALNASTYRKQYAKPIQVKVGVNRKRQANLFDPDGTRTELMEATTFDGKPAPSSNAPPPD